MRRLVEEFKKFAFRGNVIDMAVGVMIGAAFGKIVSSLVDDLFMPLLSLITGSVDFTSLAISIPRGEEMIAVRYGAFLQSVVDFLLIAVCIFFFVRLVNKLKKPEPPKAPARLCPFCREAVAQDARRCPHCTSNLE